MAGIDRKKDYPEVYADYYPLVFSAVYSKVGNREETLDICQEIFLRLYVKFEEATDYRRWLFSAMRYVVLEHFKKKRGREVNIDDVFNDISLTFVNGFRDARIIIADALENTANYGEEKDRVIFDLIAVNNFTYAEAAAHLGMTRRQAEYRYNLIVARILKYLKDRGIENIEDLL